MHPIFNTNLAELSKGLLPAMLRKKLLLALLNILIEPMQVLRGQLLSFIPEIESEFTVNGQICRLRGVLNDRFDPTARRIRITNAVRLQNQCLYLVAEEKPLYIYTTAENKSVTVYTRTDYSNVEDFNVVMNGLVLTGTLRSEITLIVNKYKLPTKTYKIK